MDPRAGLMLATRNEHKRAEFARLLAPREVEALPPDVELPPEDGETFEANALGKARAAAAATGRLVIADDSGIEAEALAGAPGILSARFAGEGASDEENLAKLVKRAPAGSGLTYVCALAAVAPDGGERVFTARCHGVVAARPAGSKGFGYDPAFVPDDVPGERTMAQLEPAEKDAISHRGRAAAMLRRWLDG
jgi:XTP/dITP diphosphohydrolase